MWVAGYSSSDLFGLWRYVSLRVVISTTHCLNATGAHRCCLLTGWHTCEWEMYMGMAETVKMEVVQLHKWARRQAGTVSPLGLLQCHVDVLEFTDPTAL